MKIGITGATGGLGRKLTELMREQGFQVKALVRDKASAIKILDANSVELVEGCLENPKVLRSFVSDLDVCYHLAACVNSRDKKELHLINVEGTQNLCNAIFEINKTCKLVYCSSIVVQNTSFFQYIFASEYTKSKCRAEKVVDTYNGKIPVTVISPGYIFGGYDTNFLPSIYKMLDGGLDFVIKGGEKQAQLVYIDDLCELFLICGLTEKAIGEKYIGIPKNEMGIHEVIKLIALKTNRIPPTKILPRFPLVLIAQFESIRSKITKSTPKLYMRVVNALSSYSKYTNNAQEIGWMPSPHLGEKIDMAICSYNENI